MSSRRSYEPPRMSELCPHCGAPLELGKPWIADFRAELEPRQPRRSWHQELREKQVPLPTASAFALLGYALVELVRLLLHR